MLRQRAHDNSVGLVANAEQNALNASVGRRRKQDARILGLKVSEWRSIQPGQSRARMAWMGTAASSSLRNGRIMAFPSGFVALAPLALC
jgi:hypothetical protein